MFDLIEAECRIVESLLHKLFDVKSTEKHELNAQPNTETRTLFLSIYLSRNIQQYI